MSSRDLDLVLLGGTGYVGRLTAQHLVRHAPSGVRVGLAGRSPDRLAALREELGPAAQDWPLVAADLAEPASLRTLTDRARVVVTTAGPYAPRGLLLVQACAEAGIAYADLTGETLFVRRSLENAHARAEATGARIVHSCGFDSVPSDLGVGLCAAQATADGTGLLREAVLHVRSARGGISGGTIDSLRQQLIETRNDRTLRAVAADPYALTGQPAHRRPRSGGWPVRRDEARKSWTATYVPGAFNRQIVQRSNALSGWAYGLDLDYREVVDTGPGPRGALAAVGLTAATGLVLAGMARAGTQRVLDRVLPDPGSGPRPATLDRGRFLVEVEAMTAAGAKYRSRIGAQLDPGYRGTAVMLGEAGLSLATDPDLPERAGVLTPTTALGGRLTDRLRAQGFTIEVD